VSHDSIICWLGRPVPYAQSFQALLDMLPKWRSTHLFEEIIPALRSQGLSDAQIETILVGNPRRFFEAGLARP
ncbi:MAG: phosphotriesterase family protein, partial [Gammaproteobacteria bacterium]